MQAEIENLVVDTSAFINNVQLQETGKHIFTIPEVVEEVRCKRQLRRLAVLPYDLQIKEVDPNCVSFINKFSKKTGDYLYLSATDIKLLALTYQLEKEKKGVSHLRTEPQLVKNVIPVDIKSCLITPGFYMPQEDSTEKNSTIEKDIHLHENDDSDCNEKGLSDARHQDINEVLEQFSRLSCLRVPQNNDQVEDGREWDNEGVEVVNNDHNSCVTDSDNAGWIKPRKSGEEIDYALDSNYLEGESVAVACLTTDFSMQNVLRQIGLQVVSFNGMLTKDIRTFVLRCYACFTVTPQTTRLFCPKCGNKTLKRVSVTVDDEGKQQVHINFRRPLTAKGKKFPLPRPKGGKHAVNPILCEDQRVSQNRLSKLALTKNNPMHPDYNTAGLSPFVMRDVSSKSSMIIANNKSEAKYWMRKNPNEVVKRKRKK